ncbi:MAG TPA: hypothetical protein VMT35_01625 [Ignavibacteriaceae bacterium]|nr:hypothetical protein [Ignavibacteriaceae bacterium]
MKDQINLKNENEKRDNTSSFGIAVLVLIIAGILAVILKTTGIF